MVKVGLIVIRRRTGCDHNARRIRLGDLDMGMGRRKHRQDTLWVATAELPRTAGHVFYERVNRILNETEFDRFVEDACEKFYAAVMGRPSLAPGKYFRMLLAGYFEGIDSERGLHGGVPIL